MKGDARKSTTSGGTGEGQTEGKKDGRFRHKISFMDELAGDKTKLCEVHLIESYKKYN